MGRRLKFDPSVPDILSVDETITVTGVGEALPSDAHDYQRYSPGVNAL